MAHHHMIVSLNRCTARAFAVLRQTPVFHVGGEFPRSTIEPVIQYLLFPLKVASRKFLGPLLDDFAYFVSDNVTNIKWRLIPTNR